MRFMRAPGHIKRAPRVSTWHRATLVASDGREIPCVVTDLSSGGFKLKADRTILIGESIRLRVDRYGDFPAQIKWAIAGEAGGEFLTPVDLD
ncbi:MAG: PilZ domain-containing protein [Sphingomicrobium sp.]|nr:PilZ domain-containing protein [Sphingomonadales bacterium]